MIVIKVEIRKILGFCGDFHRKYRLINQIKNVKNTCFIMFKK